MRLAPPTMILRRLSDTLACCGCENAFDDGVGLVEQIGAGGLQVLTIQRDVQSFRSDPDGHLFSHAHAEVAFGLFDVQQEGADLGAVIGEGVEGVLGDGLADPGEHEIEQSVIDIGAAEVVVSVGGYHYGAASLDLDDGGVEGSAAKVVHQDCAIAF